MSELTKNQSPQKFEQPPTSLIGLFLTLYWSFFGPFLLLFMAYQIINDGNLWFWISLFWLDVVALGAARYCDIRYFNGMTTEGEKATLEHWKKHTRILLGLALLVFTITCTCRWIF